MSLQELKSQLGEHAKDIKLNLGSILTEEGAPDLKQNQIYGIALASAYTTKKSRRLSRRYCMRATALTAEEVHAAKAAATIMAMNNIYYRFTHLVSDKEFSKMSAKLRMNVIGSPSVRQERFRDDGSLAVSAINGCGMCMDAHVHEVVKAGVSKTGVQSAVRIAAVINAAAQAVAIGNMETLVGQLAA